MRGPKSRRNKVRGLYMKDIDTFRLPFYDYGEAMYGSIGGMSFRIARKPLSKKDPEPPVLEVHVWRGPYNFETTTEEKQVKEFPYTEEGKKESTDWLNALYESDRENWDKGLKIR